MNLKCARYLINIPWGIKSDNIMFGGQICGILLSKIIRENSSKLINMQPNSLEINFIKPTYVKNYYCAKNFKSCPLEKQNICYEIENIKKFAPFREDFTADFSQITNKKEKEITANLKVSFVKNKNNFSENLLNNQNPLLKVDNYNFKDIAEYFKEKSVNEKEIENLKKNDTILKTEILISADKTPGERFFRFKLKNPKNIQNNNDIIPENMNLENKSIFISYVSDFLFIEPALNKIKEIKKIKESLEYYSEKIETFRTLSFKIDFLSFDFNDCLYIKSNCFSVKKYTDDTNDKHKNCFQIECEGDIFNNKGVNLAKITQKAFLKLKK